MLFPLFLEEVEVKKSKSNKNQVLFAKSTVAGALLLSLTACGGEDSPSSQSPLSPQNPSSPQSPIIGGKPSSSNQNPSSNVSDKTVKMTDVSPKTGSLLGGTLLTITGTNFPKILSITIDGLYCTSLNRISDTQIQCKTPRAYAKGAKNIRLINYDTYQHTSLDNGFSYTVSNPQITSLRIENFRHNRTNTLSISGSDFSSNSDVTIDDTTCENVRVISTTEMSCTIPAYALSRTSAGIVKIRTADGQTIRSTLRNLFSSPRITGVVSPTYSAVGAVSGFTIIGTDFRPGARVSIDGGSVHITSLNSNRISVTVTGYVHLQRALIIQVTNQDDQAGWIVHTFPGAPAAQWPGQHIAAPAAAPAPAAQPAPAAAPAGGGWGGFWGAAPAAAPAPARRPAPPATARRTVDAATAQQKLQERIAERERYPVETHNGNWGATETVMNPQTTRLMIRSINQLDTRYPLAVLNTDASVSEVYQMVTDFNVDGDAEKQLKKDAALRFLDRVYYDFRYEERSYPYPMTSGEIHPNSRLTVAQTLSLAWYAATDIAVYRTDVEREDRKRAFVDTLAIIQRAHNDSGRNSAIIWDPAVAAEKPSCSPGTFKRLIEQLSELHPDVNMTVQQARPADIARDVNDFHGRIFMNYYNALPAAEKAELKEKAENYDAASLPAYTRYVTLLKDTVRQNLGEIPAGMLEEQTGHDIICALINRSLP
jgi:hypothetical protein